MKKQDFRGFFLDKSEFEKAKFAASAGTTACYIQTHLITRYKIPRRKLMQGLAVASEGVITVDDLTKFFYSTKEKEA